ncbi:MAG: response regulator transcription factor, partial [Armatimonadota bacterium]
MPQTLVSLLRPPEVSFLDPRRIVIVEDDPQCSKLVATKLEAEGFDVEVAGSGEEGLEVIEENMPDLLMLDLIL